MCSDRSMDYPQYFSSVQRKRSETDFSHVSMRSDLSMANPQNFSSLPRKRPEQAVHSPVSIWRDISTGHQQDFRSLPRNWGQGYHQHLISRLRDCGITGEGCAALASALRSNPSHLRELDLSGNELRDLDIKLLCAALQDSHCKLEKLWLSDCGITDEGCAALASALRSNPEHLRELDLSWNRLSESDVKLLSDLKDDPHYKLERLYH